MNFYAYKNENENINYYAFRGKGNTGRVNI